MPHRAKATEGEASADTQKAAELAVPAIGIDSSNSVSTATNVPGMGIDSSNSVSTATNASEISINSSGDENGSIEKKKDSVIVDTMMGMPRLSRSDSIKSLIDSARKKREDYANIALMTFMLSLVIVGYYFAATFTGDGGCSASEGTIGAGVFCLVAGTTSLPFAVLSYVMWKKGRNPRRTRNQSSSTDGPGVGKGVFCMTFWNLVLAFFGMLMYFGQFDLACQGEPIAIFILVWSTFQFMLAVMACSAICYLTYHLTAKSRAAEDVIGAGFAFEA